MHNFWLRKALLLGCCLAGHAGLAQRGPVSLLQPSQPTVALPVPAELLGPLRKGGMAQAGATPATRPARPVVPGPLVILNARLITGLGGLDELSPDNIKKVAVYKGGNYPSATPAQWRGLDANGIIDLTLKKKVRLKSQSLTQLGRSLQAKGPVSYTINGLPAASGTLRIVTAEIEELQVVRTLAGTTLHVRVYSVSNRPAKTYPPGTIMIRGTASR